MSHGHSHCPPRWRFHTLVNKDRVDRKLVNFQEEIFLEGGKVHIMPPIKHVLESVR